MGCVSDPGADFELINPEDDPRYRKYVDLLIELAGRRGVTQEAARTMVRTETTVIAALALRCNDADAMICGLEGRFASHLRHVSLIIGARPDTRDRDLSALSMLITSRGVDLPHRYLCDHRPDGGGDRRNDDARR